MTGSFHLAASASPLSLSDDFILPPEVRPQLSELVPPCPIPTLDLRYEDDEIFDNDDGNLSLRRSIEKACEEFGIFQVINHGIPEALCQQMMNAASDFFSLPVEERARLYSANRAAPVKVFNPYFGTQEKQKVTLWSENLCHVCHPIEDVFHLLPDKPSQYREIVPEYAEEIGKLTWRLLGLICKSLGLESDYLHQRLGKHKRVLQVNCYPPCPDPELTLGIVDHTDPGLITVLQETQGVSGLQVIKDGKWMAVHPLPNALVVNLGDQLEVMTNGRYKSVHHRAVVNPSFPRISIATFVRPASDVVIGPIEDLVDDEHPPLYRNYRFEEFFGEFCKQEGMRRRIKEAFVLQP